ncbi:hypothetical protein CCUS01_06161 [Colletotrichum cuscutae]|uniref:Uncharacterized protein n=1 Tax=Colletotrichum cuscutae TaxID=1209917 RepID=A0AAI9Y4V0_9PEZI|nr:hypothetical protein CCUS01_06161 [Colletotrichum cuscutae]
MPSRQGRSWGCRSPGGRGNTLTSPSMSWLAGVAGQGGTYVTTILWDNPRGDHGERETCDPKRPESRVQDGSSTRVSKNGRRKQEREALRWPSQPLLKRENNSEDGWRRRKKDANARLGQQIFKWQTSRALALSESDGSSSGP